MSDNSCIVLYTNLFTLQAKDVTQNRYIDMYYVWLYNIIKYKCLSSNDYCITFMDSTTYAHISQNIIFNTFKSLIKNLIVIEYSQPLNIKEGMLKKYDIDKLLNITSSFESSNPYYIYLDIDVLGFKKFRGLFNTSDNRNTSTIYIMPYSELFTNNNFYGELITDEEKSILYSNNLQNMPGFSAGMFAWSNSRHIRQFFKFIIDQAINNDKKLYTVEQPFFNAAIFNYLFKQQGIFKFIIINRPTVLFNASDFQRLSDTILVDFCGIPGDGSFHWDKLLLQLFTQGLSQ
jgi:hypothetical protein